MKIQGLQKLTLLDYPGKVACTLFTDGCNLRCPFCHNASLVIGDRNADGYSEETVISFLKKRQGVLDAVCISGGEPLLQPGISAFIEKVRALGYSIKLDTNGTYPDRLRALIESGLIDYVAMDIKNSKESYAKTVGLKNFDISHVQESVDYLMKGKIPYEFRTTVVRQLHSAEDFESIGRWIEGADRYFLQGFIDSGDLICDGLSGYDAPEMNRFLDIVKEYVPSAQLRGV